MRIKNLSMFLLSIFVASQASQASFILNKSIAAIDEILQDLPQGGSTIAVLDWDGTISAEEGGHDPRELGAKGTLAIIQALHKQGIQTIVLTSRTCLVPAKQTSHSNDISSAEASVRKMLATLGNEWPAKGALKSNTLQRINPQAGSSDEQAHPLIAFKQIVFTAGRTPKGAAVAALIDLNKFKTKPTNIIFVDNEDYSTKNVASVFADRDENVYIFHYPTSAEVEAVEEKLGY